MPIDQHTLDMTIIRGAEITLPDGRVIELPPCYFHEFESAIRGTFLAEGYSIEN